MAKTRKQDGEVVMDRRSDDNRRENSDRREGDKPVAVERRKAQRREKVSRRRQIDPTTCERDYSDDEIEFMQAMDAYKRKNGRMFPTCSEILEVIRDLGYSRPGMQAGSAVVAAQTETPEAGADADAVSE